MRAKLRYVFSIAMFLFVFSTNAQNSLFKKVEKIKHAEKVSKYHLNKERVSFFELDINLLKKSIEKTPLRSAKINEGTIISIPVEDSGFENFKIFEAPVFSPELSAKYPDIKSYVGYGIDNPKARLRMSVSPLGVKTMISNPGKSTIFMEPSTINSKEYILYSKNSKNSNSSAFSCSTLEDLNNVLNKSSATSKSLDANDQTLQKFRIAISVTGEYTQYFGGTVAGALAGINATLNRVNEIFETDMAVTFELVDAPGLIYTNPNTDPYSDADDGTADANLNNTDGWSLQLQNTLSTSNALGNNLTERNNAYDIGHLFGATGGGGNSGCIGCVCENDTSSPNDKNKGAAYTSPADGDFPEGDTFDLNFVAHEIGHQMGARHTWAYTSESSNNVQSEPGSGSTIMAYAGVTESDNVQLNSDPYFHYQSIKQILDNLATKSCQTTTVITNSPPIANAGNNHTIPRDTPYVLRGSATDSDSGDDLTYCWEQLDTGIVNSSNFSSSLATGSINRSLPPSSSSNRYIPNLKSVLNGKLTESNPVLGSSWESVSSVSRTLNWALTVRDRGPLTVVQNGQTSYDTMAITVDASAGPFRVTSQNTSNINLTPGSTQAITWDVANTNSGSVNVSNVNILLSTDGGYTYTTTLVANTPNDGSEDIDIPFISAPHCRIMVEAVNNIFYAINDEDFAINYTVNTTCQPTYASGSNLNLPISDGLDANHTINVPDSGIISGLSVSVNISHTWVNDLVVTLTHPNGTSASKIWNRNCSSENNIVITFENWADNINCAQTNNGSTFAPSELLDIFEGLDASGNWQINVKDLVSGDNGTLNSWSLDICTETTTLTDPDIEEPVVIEGLRVYPNPTNNNVWVAFNSVTSNPINIKLFDIRGRLVLNNNYNNVGGNFQESIGLNKVQSGMYVLTINDGNIKATKKIIVN
ncbi:T9SS type A sorting domain-containing protein [Flavobacteriaceae bacterium XHP0103]|uniref:zinc-dependent metalloprotease n=1 Tax=Marixanthotalea marina TaxID=2844359 RepID=UPI002989C4A9|nr:zinc-dependent metalloprotease family protein [Marixanthotalea marina]MBU3820534.1 T9SS type A sorting domain-containing protein [Marixanthotalea marina]